MGLLTIIRKVKRKEREIRVLLVGLDNAGKTTIVKKICGDDISTVSPTLGFQIKTVRRDGYALNVWDVGGQKSLRSYWRNYFERTDALIWVVDSADTARMQDCQLELHRLLQEERLAGGVPADPGQQAGRPRKPRRGRHPGRAPAAGRARREQALANIRNERGHGRWAGCLLLVDGRRRRGSPVPPGLISSQAPSVFHT